MKRPLAALFFSTLLLTACDDDVLTQKVPVDVRQALFNTFPQASYIEWEKSGKDYEAEFVVNTAEHSALFRSPGMLLQYKRQVLPTNLPEPVSAAITESYPGFRLEEAEEVVKEGSTSYQVELKSKSKEMNLTFSADGQQLHQPYWD